MGVRLLRGLLGLGRGISTVVGAAILLAVMVLAAAFYITALDKLVTASQQAMKRVSEAASTTATLSSVKALWSFNGSHITIYIENQAPKTLLVVAIAVVYTDGSHSVWDKANSTSIALPLAVAPATSTTIAIDTGGKTPATASLAVEASPVVAVVAAKRQDQAPTTRAITIEPVAPGATTWLGKAAIPTTRSATTTKNYPQQLTSTPLNSTITRISRSTITYTDFEVVPVPGWTNYGGSWSNTTGFKGSALQGTDQKDDGIGKAVEYYYNNRLDTYTSLWVSVKTRLVGGPGGALGREDRYGIALINGDLTRLYAIVIRDRKPNQGQVEVRSFNVEAKNDWSDLNTTSMTSYSRGSWYVIVVNYSVTTTAVNFYVWVYDTSGEQLAYLTASSTHTNRFTPAYIGVIVDDLIAAFDDFIIATADPRYITVSGLPGADYTIKIIDNLGNTVSTTTSTSTTVTINIVNDMVVGTGVDGRIEVYNPNGSLVAWYNASDCILGGDVYMLTAVSGVVFSDVASFLNVVQLFNANMSLSLITDAVVTLRIYVNSTQILCRNIYGGFSISTAIPSNLLQGAKAFNVTLAFNSTSPFSVSISWLEVRGFGYFTDKIIDALLLGSGTAIRFYNATELASASASRYLYNVSAYTQFNGSAAIAYNSSNYVLYMVNGSGVYSWNPLGWSLKTSSCRAVGSGARVEVVGRFVAVLPGEPSGYACVYDVSRGVAYNISLATYRLYRYTASAVNGTAVVFTALDSMGRVALLSLDLSTNSTRRLAVLPMSCATGLAVSSSRAYIVLCGVWRGVIGVEGSGAAVWIYDAKARTSGLVLVTNNSTVQLMGCCDRVEIYKDMLIAVDTQNILTIDRASKLVVEKSATIYGT
jgi:hypothetical protein